MALVLLSQSKLQSFLLKLILGWIYAFSFALFLKVIKRMHCKGCRCGLTWFDMEWLDMDMEHAFSFFCDFCRLCSVIVDVMQCNWKNQCGTIQKGYYAHKLWAPRVAKPDHHKII